jgi:uncharacterized protein (DUF1684 family)
MKKILILLPAVLFFLTSCGKNVSPETEEYFNGIKFYQAQKDSFMQFDSNSPFNQDPNAHFAPLKYYEPNESFKFQSKLYEYEPKDTIIILGTKGEERKVLKYGYVLFNYEGSEYKINVYQGVSRSGEEYHSIWFTDKTTGDETYGVGRYIDFELNPEKEFIYTIDFNLAYNPYCAYSAKYSCAIPTKEDYIDLAIKAGEKRFH